MEDVNQPKALKAGLPCHKAGGGASMERSSSQKECLVLSRT
jgi:hypothetical protein